MEYDEIFGTIGDDVFSASLEGSTEYDGAEGIDEILYQGDIADYSFALDRDVLVIFKPGGESDRALSIEQLRFTSDDEALTYHEILNLILTDEDDFIYMPNGINGPVTEFVNGGAGSDRFFAGDTEMLLDGGGTEYDQIYYSGAATDYSVVRTDFNEVTVTRADGTIDVLRDFEGAWFIGEAAWYSIDSLVTRAVMRGAESGDQLTGTLGDDILEGAGGQDFFTVIGGDNVLIGGTYTLDGSTTTISDGGEYDQIYYSGAAADYTLTTGETWQGAGGFVRVERPDGGVDLINGIEGIWFLGEAAWYSVASISQAPEPATGTDESDTVVLPVTETVYRYDALAGDDDITSNDLVSAEIQGGSGVDQVRYDGPIADYEFDQIDDPFIESAHALRITKPGGAIDVLSGVELISFADREAPFSFYEILNRAMSDEADVVHMPSSLEGITPERVDSSGGRDNFIAGLLAMNIDGGGDEYDQVTYQGPEADYTFQLRDNGQVWVTRGDGTVDILSDIDGVWFSQDAVWRSLPSLVSSAVYRASEADDQITDTIGNDEIQGGGGSDYFSVQSGDNVIIGGGYELVDDVAVLEADTTYDQIYYAGDASEYVFESGAVWQGADGFIEVTRPDGGVDLIQGIDGVWFQGEGAWYSINSLVVDPPPGDTVIGTGADDNLSDLPGDTRVFGFAGMDRITIVDGDNIIFGGAAELVDDELTLGLDDSMDQVNYSGDPEAYEFYGNEVLFGENGFTRVVRPDGGEDYLYGIEGILFTASTEFVLTEDLVTIDGLRKSDVDYFAFAGQSNAERHFFTAPNDQTGTELGNVTFSQELEQLAGHSGVRVIEAATSGSGSNENVDPESYWWNLADDEPGPELLASVEMISSVIGDDGDLDGIVWAQGEDDAASITSLSSDGVDIGADLKAATLKVFEYYWSNFGSDVPIFIQRLATDFPETPSSFVDGPEGSLALIRSIQEELVAENANVYYGAETNGLDHYDTIHFTNEALGQIAAELSASVYEQLTTGDVVGPPPPAEPITLEAEAIIESGFVAETRAIASGEAVASLFETGETTGVLSHTYIGPDGVFDIAITAHDENDGTSVIEVLRGETVIEVFTLDNNTLPGAVTEGNRVVLTASGVELTDGETIRIRATQDGDEWARIDVVQLTPTQSVASNLDTMSAGLILDDDFLITAEMQTASLSSPPTMLTAQPFQADDDAASMSPVDQFGALLPIDPFDPGTGDLDGFLL